MFHRITGSVSGIYHKLTKDKVAESHPALSGPSDQWPDSWQEQNLKSYVGAPTVQLVGDDVSIKNISLSHALSLRRSSNSFTGVMDTKQLGTLLVSSAGITNVSSIDVKARRPYPSGGTRYPLEIYVWCKTVVGIDAGVYHFRPDTHELELLYISRKQLLEPSILLGSNWSWGASAVIFLTATFERSQEKYGERGYRYVLLEAGHLVQNLHLIASSLGLKNCPFGSSRDEMIERVLDIDGVSESLVHTLIIG